MDSLVNLFNGFQVALSGSNLLFCFLGVSLGMVVGILPGIGPVAGIALLIPLTYDLDPTTAIIMLSGIYYSCMYAGTITSVLINVPGETASVITCIDGYQMAKNGRAGAALGVAAIGSFVGSIVTLLLLAFAGPKIAEIALSFGPAEFLSVMFLGLMMVNALMGKSFIKGMMATFIGLFFATVGMDPISGTARFTFNNMHLIDGIDFVIMAMGLFGISEIFLSIDESGTFNPQEKISGFLPKKEERKSTFFSIIRGTLIGGALGMVPGATPSISSIMSYSVEKKLYADENDFSCVYPFVPYQFNLLGSVLTSIRTHGASGKHLSEGERSMLAMFKESAVEYKDKSEGAIIPFYAFYDALENFLDHSHRGVILKAYENSFINPEGKEKDVFAVNVLKTLFMIKYCNDICNANIDNITSLMISNIDEDRIELKAKVEDALKVLMRQMLVQKNGDIYVFLTNEEQEINREIDSQNVEMAEIINKVSEIIFEDIFTDKKYRYPALNGRYSFPFNQTVDDRPYKLTQSYDIGVRILTPASDYGSDETTLRMMSGQGSEVLVVLPDDRAFMDEIQTYLKIEKYLRFNTSSSSLSKYETIKEAKRVEMRERNSNAKLFLTEALKEASIYVNGDKAQINSKDVSSRINEAIGRLVTTVYHKLSYIDTAMGEDDIRKMMRSSNQLTLNLDGSKEANTHALDDVLQYVAGNTHMHIKTSMKTLKDRFMKAPYGFVEDDVEWLVARLFKRGDLSFTVNGADVTLLNKSDEEIVSLITKKASVEKLLMEQRIRVSDKNKKIVRNVMKELFHTSSVNEDEDSVMKNFQSYSQHMLTGLHILEARYDEKKYPGKNVVVKGKQLLEKVIQQSTPLEFFHTVAGMENDLIEFAYDFDPVKAFFSGEQKTIFERALDMLAIYDDSKTYIVDANLEAIVVSMRSIVQEAEPYQDIPKLPELREKFMGAYMQVLHVQEAPVYSSIDEAKNRVMEILSGKDYKSQMEEYYLKQFAEIREEASHCNNVSRLRGYADRAEALKLRILNDMDNLDAEIAHKKAAEEERIRKEAEKNGEKPVAPVAPIKPKPKKKKNIAIKSVTMTSSWRIESEDDIEKYLETLRRNLEKQLEKDTIVNVEF